MRRRLSLWLTGAVALAGLATAGPSAQNLAGLFANWKDLETWSRPLTETREVELGLGLQPGGAGGSVLLAFVARRSVLDPAAPATILVQLGAGSLANPNLVRTPTLAFLADAGSDRRLTIDLSPALRVDDSTPGGNIQNGVAEMRAADFARLAVSETLSGNVFGFDVIFRADQIRAMKTFASELRLPLPQPKGQ